MNKPNFLIVGAAKSGTTSLYKYLSEHPDIFMPEIIKEPRYFVSDIFINQKADGAEYLKKVNNTTIDKYDDYIHLFDKADSATAIGEASVPYLYYHKTAIKKIKQELGDIKIIIMLRNPIDRGYSAYTYLVRENAEQNSFEQGLTIEEVRLKQNYLMLYYYKHVGLYFEQVQAYLKIFTNVKVILFDDFNISSEKIVSEVQLFLNVDTNYTPSNINYVYNKSGAPKNQLINKFITRPNSIKKIVKFFIPKIYRQKIKKKIKKIKTTNLVKPQMNPETRKELTSFFKEDILKLQKLLNRDLSHWINDNK